jgi:hypothetical protein
VPDVPSVDELEALSTEQLRQRAFDRAEQRKDVGFFWDVFRHLPAAEGVASEDGSAGHIAGGIAEAVEGVREMLTGDLGEVEPLVRAKFISYLREES